jgi:PhzF family phenazine biosynthesis protein
MPLRLFQVDAFTDRPFAGNPAAVCLLDGPRDDAWMQAVAAEMNLSETAFLLPEGDGHRLRWFTPTVEVDLCGHATLASAHVLWEEGLLADGAQARFATRSGPLTATRRGSQVELDFPAVVPQPADPPSGLLDALGVEARAVARAGDDYLVEVASEAALRALQPDLARLRAVEARGVIVTARPAPGTNAHFVSRFFAPASGIDEDPVTGSAHCALAHYWAAKLGRGTFRALQLSARGGVVDIGLLRDRVLLRGTAVTIFRGDLLA